MKKKKKYRCIKQCGDISLMLGLYQYAYQCFIQSDEQLRKIDDYLWLLGCVQGKLACMTISGGIDFDIDGEDLENIVDGLISEAFLYSRKAKIYNF